MADANKRDYREALDVVVESFERASHQVDKWRWGGGQEADVLRQLEANPAFQAAKRRRSERFWAHCRAAAERVKRWPAWMRGGME